MSITAQKKPSEKGAEAVADREKKYGHPADIFGRTAFIWTGILLDKLKDGAFIEAHEVGLMMAGHKIAREAEVPNVVDDNLTDISGYADTVSMVYERSSPSSHTT